MQTSFNISSNICTTPMNQANSKRQDWFAFVDDDQTHLRNRIHLSNNRKYFYTTSDSNQKDKKRISTVDILEKLGQQKIYFWFDTDKEGFVESLLEVIRYEDRAREKQKKWKKIGIIAGSVVGGISVITTGIICGILVHNIKKNSTR